MMIPSRETPTVLHDVPVPLRMKLSALWATVMFCYVYGDVFGFLKPGTIQALLEGKAGPQGPMAVWILLAMATSMVIPSLMVFLSLVLRPTTNRWANVILGSAYTVIIVITAIGGWSAWGSVAAFYVFLGGVEAVLTALIAWYAWTWSKRDAT
jgi:hypothetical protein